MVDEKLLAEGKRLVDDMIRATETFAAFKKANADNGELGRAIGNYYLIALQKSEGTKEFVIEALEPGALEVAKRALVHEQ